MKIIEQFAVTIVLCLCFTLSRSNLIRSELSKETSTAEKGISPDEKFFPYSLLKTSYKVIQKPAKEVSNIFDAEFTRPHTIDGVGRFGNSGLSTIIQGLEGVAGFFGGNVGLLIGAPIGLPVGAILGGLKGAYSGSEIGSEIAKSPFRFFKKLGSLGGQSFGSYTSYSGPDGIKHIIAHPKVHLRV